MSSGVSDEAVAKALSAFVEHRVNTKESRMRAALAAALPHLQPQSVASRERVAEAVEAGAVAIDVAKYFRVGDMERFVDALLAAGVFREPPTREQLSEHLLAKLIVLDETAPNASAVERSRAQADGVLNLLGGAK